MNRRSVAIVAIVAAIIGLGAFLIFRDSGDSGNVESEKGDSIGKIAEVGKGEIADAIPETGGSAGGAEPVADGEEEMSEEEKREAAEEKLVDDFDAETDRWMDAETTKPPTMKEIDAFHAKFKGLPKERKEECLQRALNLIPDENVMLLVGILMDKTEDKELVELIYNDVLNRDEGVKKPILQQIFKDKTHPCWADTAWILDVTGEQGGTEGSDASSDGE